MLRLNGGLGTSMGLTGAKSLLEAKDGNSFLDIIARQVLALRERYDARLPLVLMDSFSTREDSLEALARAPASSTSGSRSTSSRTRSRSSSSTDLTPVEWPDDPALEWCPPGHGDLYTALVTSRHARAAARAGLRVRVRGQLGQPRRGAGPAHPRLAARRAASRSRWRSPTARRPTARAATSPSARSDGRLVLRETAQTPEEDLEALQDITRHRYVNTNNLWVSLRALDEAMRCATASSGCR